MEPLTFDELRAVGAAISQTFQHEKKDLSTYLLAARTLFTAALALAEAHPDQAKAYKQMTVMTSFNIASFCWPGWEDAHENITAEQRALALEMCHYNVATAEALDMPPGRRSVGQWILGAHLIAGGQYDAARESFKKSLAFSKQAESTDGALMAQGWMLVCDILAGDEAKRAELERLSAELTTLGEDGEFYASQFEPALNAFS